MLDRVQTPDAPVAILLSGLTPDGTPYEATIRSTDLDQLAELAQRTPGRVAHQGPVRVTILSPLSGARS